MRHPEATPRTRNTRRTGPGRTVITGLLVVAAGLLVALVGAQMVVAALGPAGALAAGPALTGVALLCVGGLIECLGVAVFSKRLTSVEIVRTSPLAVPTTLAV